ncbi:hypothetical protein [Streptomyces sp. NPDC002521]
MNLNWPTAELDPVRRLRVTAAGLHAVMYAETHADLPMADMWAVASDLEGELPHLVPTLRAFHCHPLSGERQLAWAYGPLGHRARFDVRLRTGWCLMQSRHVVGGMAAVAEGSGTRFAVLGGLRRPWSVPVQRALRPLGHSRGLLMVERAARRPACGAPPQPEAGLSPRNPRSTTALSARQPSQHGDPPTPTTLSTQRPSDPDDPPEHETHAHWPEVGAHAGYLAWRSRQGAGRTRQ